jgi:acetyl coenzyme A synthetase (ADP forming)-like protein
VSAPPPSGYAADALLRDGRSVHIRAIRPDDKEYLLAHFHGLGPDSVRFRFLGAKKELTEADLRYFTELDFVRHVGLVVTRRREQGDEFIGVGRYVCCDNGGPGRAAEFALAVTDPWQGRGVGTLLLEHLARIAARAGVERFQADILEANTRMLDVIARLGFRVEEKSRDGVVRAWFEIEPNPDATRASDERAWRAAAHSVRAVLHPRSVAVVGASTKAGSIGAALIRNVVRNGFQGPIYPVNPKGGTIEGLPAYPTVQAIGQPVDLGVIAVPAAAVHEAVADCAAAGARGVVVISAGFAEASAEGREAQRRLRELARGAGMRMVGPNCMGVLNTDPAVSLDATFAPTFPPEGNVAMLSQSGALGLAILDYARELDIGLSTFVSVGNKADISGNDLLAYWKEDPRTAVIALYLESFGNPRRFARWAPEVARKKPVVAVKSGRSAAGTRAASSHSAALAALDVAVDALFDQAGVIRTETLEEMFDVITLLATQPVPGGPRVGVVTNAGGPGILLADACEARGLALPELAPETVERLRTFLPPAAGLKNPVDMIASATPEQFTRTIAAVGADPRVDSVVVIYVPPMVTNASEIADAIAQGAGTVPAGKPVLTVFLSTKGAPADLARGPRGKLPSYSFPENAARALAAAERYGRWRARPAGQAARLDRPARDTVRAIVDRAMAGRSEPFWLEPAEAEAVLRAAGIPLAPSRVVSPETAPSAADELGYPLVAKAVSRRLLHKSDVGGVVLGLASAADVAAAVRTMRARVEAAGHPLESVLLQRQVSGGVEALVGVVGDSTFGPLIVCGLGGVQVELLRDASFRMPPVTDLDARDMIERLRLKALFEGYRGAPPADRLALEALIQRVSALVEAVPELRELDLNPVKVLQPGEGVVIVDARLRVGPVAPDAG